MNQKKRFNPKKVLVEPALFFELLQYFVCLESRRIFIIFNTIQTKYDRMFLGNNFS